MLLHSRVETTLDLATVGIGSMDEPLPGRPQIGDLSAKLSERFLQRFELASFQIDLRVATAKLSVIARAASSRPASQRHAMAASRCTRLPAP